MATTAGSLTIAEFIEKYSRAERAYEYWHGEVIPKAMPTWIHAFLQSLIIKLLFEIGYKPGPEVDLRIDPDVIPRPDIIATRGKMEHPYPTKAVEVVVEILSPDDRMSYLLEKCRSYEAWGFEYIYVVDPDSRQVFRWTARGLETVEQLVSIPVAQIWSALDEAAAS
jgi:Uma2 family endonuclease